MADLPAGWTVSPVPGPRWWGSGRRWQAEAADSPGKVGGFTSEAEAVAFAWKAATKPADPQLITLDQVLTVDLAPGATVVLRTDRHLSDQVVEALVLEWRYHRPDNPVIVLEGGLHLDAVLAPEGPVVGYLHRPSGGGEQLLAPDEVFIVRGAPGPAPAAEEPA